METMYQAQPLFDTTLDENISDTQTNIKVTDLDKFPNETPNLATIIDNTTEDLETIEYTGKDETNSELTGVTRGIEGTAKSWDNGTLIGRYHTAEEQNNIISNINEVETDLSDHKNAGNPHSDSASLADLDDAVPSGVITMYSGSTAPSGWTLCDGTDGAPDLRDRFIVGAGDSYDVDDTGGADSVTLSESEIPSHDHSSGTLEADDDSHSHSDNFSVDSDSHSHGDGSLSTGTDGYHGHSGSTNSTGSHTHSARSGTGSFNSSYDEENYFSSGSFSLDTTIDGHTNVSGVINSSGSHSHSVSINSNGSHSHSVSGTTSSDSHSHSLSGGVSSDTHNHSISGSTGSTGGDNSHENRPPYYALAFIMKL